MVIGDTRSMKTVLLLRHAVAANDPNDKKRPLTAHGRQQATSIGRWMANHFVTVDTIISSSAKRARQTAEICAEITGFDEEVFLSEDLYEADAGTHLEAIKGLADDIRSVLFVGHNPEISGVATLLTGKSVAIGNAMLVIINLPVTFWADMQERMGELDRVLTPV